ncbi:MAG: inositol monophosphatase family protein [Bacteroidota bacterium]
MNHPDLDTLDASLRELLHKTGAFARREFERFSFSDVVYKGENNPFTYVDVTAENMLRDGCAALIPGSGFVNEEGEDIPSQNGFTWIIDPIDGTANFTHGVPHYCISLALQDPEGMWLGYIYAPESGDLFHAVRGGGAFLQGKPIQVSEQAQMPTSLIATGFPYDDMGFRDRYLVLLNEVMQKSQGMRRMGSAALDLAYVASGRFEAFFEYNLNAWDVAAGALILQEAGGQVSDFNGGEDYLFGKQILATNGKIHTDLLEILQRHDLLGSV